MTHQQQNVHEPPSLNFEQFTTKLNQNSANTIDNDTPITSRNSISSLSDLQQEYDPISSCDSNQFSSIPYIDSSSIDDSDISDNKQYVLNSLNRQTSFSETDLLASLHRNKQLSTNQSEPDIPSDDILFLEWDKERNLFQTYINSLRKEIRVLLQERLEYQTQKSLNNDEMKIDLLQKSLEEKNYILEQLQTDYELLKDKNTNFLHQITLYKCDTQSHINSIDELKQKINELTIDLQNHKLIKQRLEISIHNLEDDCKIIDTERIKLTNDIKESQHNQQDLEKLLQKANVQIAEQGSTIEMLRSENVQVRSQLSTIQRRMFQEKQQIMDYLRQIENDLIEKEQIKQRELLLRQDYEQLQIINKQDRKEIEHLKNSINHDQQKIEELQEQCSQLLNTIQIQDEEKKQYILQLDSYQTEIKKHLNDEPIDQLIPISNDQYQSEQLLQTPAEFVSELNNERDKLQQDFDNLTIQYKELDQDYQAWRLYQQNQLLILRDRCKLCNDTDDNLSFDDLLQQIENRFRNLENECDTLANRVIELQATTTPDSEREDKLRQDMKILANQCAQLDEANRAWQQFQQNQLESFRNKLQYSLPIDNNSNSFDEIAQLIVDHIKQLVNERDTLIHNNIQTTEKLHNDFESEPINNINIQRQEYIHSIHEQSPSQEISINNLTSAPMLMNEHDEEIRKLRENLANLTTQCTQLDEANQVLVLQEQLDNKTNDLEEQQMNDESKQISKGNELEFVPLNNEENVDVLRKEFEDIVSIDYNVSFEGVVRQIVDEMKRERKELDERYEALEKTNYDIRIEADNNMELIRESCLNSIKELNEELLNMKEECNEFERRNKELLLEIETLNNQLNDRSIVVGQHSQSISNLLEQQNSVVSNEEFHDQATSNSDENNLATTPVIFENNPIQIDTIDKQIQTESFYQLWSTDEAEKLSNNYEDDDDRLNEYINEISSLSPTEVSNQLNQQCQQILSKENLSLTSFPNLESNHLSLLALHSLYTQHLTDEAKQLYNETIVRALKQEYELLNNEKTDLIEQLNSFRLKNDELLQQIELEQIHTKALIEKYELNENQLKNNLLQLTQENQQTIENKYEELEKEYNQLKLDFNELINENELLKDYNAQMYQEKFQEKEDNGSVESKKSHNVDIQCNLNSEDSNWNNDWNADTTISTQDQASNEQEIIRLKTIIEEIQNENENLRVLSNCINNQSISVNTFTQTETENENNDWNEDVIIPQISTVDQTSNEQEIIRLKTIIEEVQNENENLRVLSNCINNQSISINTFTQTEYEDNDEISSVKDDSSKQTIDNQTQTDDQPQDKLTQTNTKLKRALQTIKDKINRIVIEQPELFPESTDDTIVRLDHLISAIEQQAIQIDLLKTKSDISIPTLSVQEIEQIIEERNQLQSEKLTNNEEIHNLRSQLVGRGEQVQELNEKYSEIVSNVEKPNIETVDNETQTDEQQKDKLAQINNKLKRALQNIKEKIQRIVNEKPELFVNSSDDTVERLDNLLSAIEILQNERDHALQKIDELQNTNRDQIDNMSSSITTQIHSEDSLSEDYQKQIDQLQKHLSQKDEERSLLRERLNEVEVEFRKTLDDHESTVNKYEFLKQERDVLIEQQEISTTESQNKIEELENELDQLKQSAITQHAQIQTDKNIQSLETVINQQSQQIIHLNDKNTELLSQLETHAKLDHEKEQTEKQLAHYQKQLKDLLKQNTNLTEELKKSTISSPVETTDNESQTDERQQEKLAQVNNKLKRALQGIKDKIHRVVNEKPDLFDGVSEDTSERLEHLISTVENQAAYINILQSERDQVQEQLTSPSAENSSSIVDDYQQQIHQLQQNLLEKDEQQSLLKENLNKVEAELEQIRNDYSSIVTEYKLLVQQQTQESQNSQLEIQQLKESADLKQSVTHEHIETQTDEDINALHELIEEQSQQMKALNEINNEKKELEERLNERESQIKNLMEEIANSKSSHAETTDNECQTEELQEGKGAQMNKKLKRSLQGIKDKIHRVVNEKPDLFDGVSEDTTERLDHLISTIENQTAYINILQSERDQVQEQLTSPSAENSSSIVDDYQQQIHQLQQNLSQKDEQQSLLQQNLNNVEAELEQVRNDYSSIVTEYELLGQQQTQESQNSQLEIQQLKEAVDLKQSVKYEHVETQTDEE
ncbi:unnamed protein product [Adineta steineri]|uniref:Uncharacterized protein n=1 Tax=Adineta steineri TaxID=433720 RepID=A0A816DDJ6_9BILA|nr:unnamed protein product [Adineta steineri]CAF1633324.1 unnamed protein product [Adineta steineri]